MAEKHRINLTINADLFCDLDYVARNLNVSRSALVSQLLSEPLRVMVEALGGLDLPSGSHDSVRRARGQSLDAIGDLVRRVEAQYQALRDEDSGRG